MKKKEITLPTVLGLFLAIAGLVSGLWLLGGQLRQVTTADVDEAPDEVKVVNASDNSFTVTWVTQKATSGFLQYGELPGSMDLVISDERDQQKGAIGNYFTHFVTIKDLASEKEYSFRIGSGKRTYDLSGEPYTVTTGKKLETAPAADVAYGQVLTESQEAAEGAIVYLAMADVSLQAALVKSTGAWVIPLSTARNTLLSEFAAYDMELEEIEIVVDGGPMGEATMYLTTQNDSPVPDITLGETYDFRGEKQSDTPLMGSKFSAESLGPATEIIEGGDIELVAPRFGEKINSLRPEIIGEAPPGTTVTIEIQSDPIIGQAVADKDGKFSFSMPADLEPGVHTVTITAIIDGVSQRVSRSFTVYAAGEASIPAFSATPSATLAPSPTARAATPTTRPNATPTAGPSPKASPTPSTKPSATPAAAPTPTPLAASASAIPQAGVETPTIWILVLGVGLILVGGWWYKKA